MLLDYNWLPYRSRLYWSGPFGIRIGSPRYLCRYVRGVVILYATILSNTFSSSIRWHIGRPKRRWGIHLFFPGLSIRTRLAIFQKFENEQLRRHVIKIYVSFSLGSRRIVPRTRRGTSSGSEATFSPHIFSIARENTVSTIDVGACSIVCRLNKVLSPCELGKCVLSIFTQIYRVQFRRVC